MEINIRGIQKADLPALKEVLNSIELFPAEMLEDMSADYLNNPQSEDIWFTALTDDKPIALAYCAPEKLTEGTYNLYAIGVKSDLQSNGIGAKMMSYLEDLLITNGQRLLIVDTSGTTDFSKTRKFYEDLNYEKEAVIRDFWAEGDDKVTYRKKLS